MKSTEFSDTSFMPPTKQEQIIPQGGLILRQMGSLANTPQCIPKLDDGPGFTKKVPFELWWSEPVFTDLHGHQLSRRELILTMANQDGGAHVDASIEKGYTDLSKNNALGWCQDFGDHKEPSDPPHLAAVRQIGHEILKTLKPDYEKRRAPFTQGLVIGGISIQGIPGKGPFQLIFHGPKGALPGAPVGAAPRGDRDQAE
jgi:hypothetical protein